MKKIISLILLVVCITFVFASCGGNSSKNIIGTWVVPDAANQKLEILTEEIRFNYRRFNYTVKGDIIHLEETFPNKSLVGDISYELNGDSLTIDLGTEFGGFFYGRTGTVYLERK